MKKLFFILCIITCPFIYISCDIKEELNDLLTFDSNCDGLGVKYFANLRTEGCLNSNSMMIQISEEELTRLTQVVLCNSSDDCVAVTVNPLEGEPTNGYLKKINHNEGYTPDSCFFFSKYSSSVCGYVIE